MFKFEHVFVPSIICRRKKFLLCKENEYTYIDNEYFEVGDLLQDGIHLLKCGKTKLVRNFIYFLTFLTIFLYKNYLEKGTNLERNLSPSYSDVKNTKDCQSV